jgi:hydroxymethylbilane synthase
MKIRIGTRGSQLALWQAFYIENLLKAAGMATEIVTIETKGDKILDVSLSKIGSKGVFTEELEDQLRSGDIDIAVHSAKDLQSDLHEDFEILAFTERELVNDVVVSLNPDFSLADQSQTLVVGTSSTRRIALMQRNYPHVQLVEMRGNLQTRLKKLADGHCQALLLAYAGVHRMNYHQYIVQHLPLDSFTPAVGQGSVAVEVACSLSDDKKAIIRQACNHVSTEICLLAERAFLNTMQGGCSVPVFGLAQWNGTQLQLKGGVVSLDGKQLITHSLSEEKAESSTAKNLGKAVAQEILAQGGGKILEEIRRNR